MPPRALLDALLRPRLAAFAGLAAVAAAAAAAAEEGAAACATKGNGCVGPANGQDLIAQLGGYQATQRPLCGSGSPRGPTVVEVQLYLTQVNDVDQKLGQVSLNGYFRAWWQDPRLAFNSTAQGGCAEEIDVAVRDLDRVWQPDLYIDNSVEQTIGEKLLIISPDGSVRSSKQIQVQVKVPINLGKLPYDNHTCMITVASYSQSNEKLRLIARHGSVGIGSSGVGLIGDLTESSMWTFDSNEGFENSDGSIGFEMPGRLQTKLSWDYLHLEFRYKRRPKYFVDQTITPSLLFLLVAYMQFFVDPAAVPARAAIALISVLVMRTMSNSVYQSLPQGSQRMWLSDCLTAAVTLNVLAACEFGIVQMFLLVEKQRAAELAGLLKSKPIAERLKKIYDEEGVTLLELLERCRPVKGALSREWLEVSEPVSPPSQIVGHVGAAQDLKDSDRRVLALGDESPRTVATERAPLSPTHTIDRGVLPDSARDDFSLRSRESMSDTPYSQRSDFARKHRIGEADLLYIKHAEAIFRRADRNGLNGVSPAQVRKAVAHFNIYMTTAQAASIMCMFLRDEGRATPLDEMDVRVTFCQFQFLLMSIESYPRGGFRYAHTCWDRFWTTPPSKRTDVIARHAFPILVVFSYVMFYLMLPLY